MTKGRKTTAEPTAIGSEGTVTGTDVTTVDNGAVSAEETATIADTGNAAPAEATEPVKVKRTRNRNTEVVPLLNAAELRQAAAQASTAKVDGEVNAIARRITAEAHKKNGAGSVAFKRLSPDARARLEENSYTVTEDETKGFLISW